MKNNNGPKWAINISQKKKKTFKELLGIWEMHSVSQHQGNGNETLSEIDLTAVIMVNIKWLKTANAGEDV
jgi:hypothetical protein